MIQGQTKLTLRIAQIDLVDELPVVTHHEPFPLMGVLVPAQVSSSSYESPVIEHEGKTVNGAMSLYVETYLPFRSFLFTEPDDDLDYINQVQKQAEVKVGDRWLRIFGVRDFNYFAPSHPGRHYRYIVVEPEQL